MEVTVNSPSSAISNTGQAAQPVTATPASENNTQAAKQSFAPGTTADSVKISQQAQQLRQSESSKNNNQVSTVSNDFVRVTSSIGRASSSAGLSNDEALSLYRSIARLL